MQRFSSGVLAGAPGAVMVLKLRGLLFTSLTKGVRGPVPVRVSPGDANYSGASRWVLTMEEYFGHTVNISDGVSSRKVYPPEAKVWGDAVLHASGTALYAIEYDKIDDHSYLSESFIRIPLPQKGLAQHRFKRKVVLVPLEVLTRVEP